MDINRIRQATADIEYYSAALDWLEKYGALSIKEAEVRVGLFNASACFGHSEACKVISSYTKKYLQDSIGDAISCCKNTIEIAQNIIREEATKE